MELPESQPVPPAAPVFLKLGGSLITDKTLAQVAHEDTIARLAAEVRRAMVNEPALRLLMGHGSGSFGHWEAARHGTRQGVHGPAQWKGYAEVAAAAARLNRIVTDVFLREGVPVLSVQPSASARCHVYGLQYLDTAPIREALAHGLVPLVYGDVALDDVHGGTIISTEDIFVYLAGELRPTRILLTGVVRGVLDRRGEVVDRITPESYPALGTALAGSDGVDVTGGMADKVSRMVGLVARLPGTCARIFSGSEPGTLTRVLVEPDLSVGTCIAAA